MEQLLQTLDAMFHNAIRLLTKNKENHQNLLVVWKPGGLRALPPGSSNVTSNEVCI